ncbi:hypothetical protein OESDEN_10421 [Oesophagostomum dentatum]|uniref:Uncharacterized protein n=1 Tax=Oesophagostomum dentatum TaxID=61180 RepID=A0A0B1T0R3_OESDE|nr:hypothetical protein OESDEN_10421 [Oesophagostomum dentatum]
MCPSGNAWFAPRLHGLQRDYVAQRLPPPVRNSGNKEDLQECNSMNIFGNQWFAARRSSWPSDPSSNIGVPSVANSLQAGFSAKQRCSRSTKQNSTVKGACLPKDYVDCDRRIAEYSKDVIPIKTERVRELPSRNLTTLQASSGDFAASLSEQSPVPDETNDHTETLDEGLQSDDIINSDISSAIQLAPLGNNDRSTAKREVDLSKEDLSSQLEEDGTGSPKKRADCLEEEQLAKLEHDENHDLKEQVDCLEEDLDTFFESSLTPLEQCDPQVNRVLRVMIDILHPDARRMQVMTLVTIKNDFTDFLMKKLPFQGIDVHKEIAMLSRLAEDLRNVPAVVLKDENEWLLKYQSIKEISDALDTNDRRRLTELGVVDTAQRVSERLLLGMDVSSEEVMELLRDSMKTGFGEYTWLIENHPELINKMEHFEHYGQVRSAPVSFNSRCYKLANVIPQFLSMLAADDLENCAVTYIGKYASLGYGQSWVELVRNAKEVQDLSLKLTAQFFFCSVNCGAEELLGVLLENIPLEKKIMAIKSIDCMPVYLRSALIPSCCESAECGLYNAIRRMVEEMSLARFRTDAVFLIQMLCQFCSLSPSLLMSKTLFPLMSSPAKGKAAIAISSLLSHEVFKKEVSDGSFM